MLFGLAFIVNLSHRGYEWASSKLSANVFQAANSLPSLDYTLGGALNYHRCCILHESRSKNKVQNGAIPWILELDKSKIYIL